MWSSDLNPKNNDNYDSYFSNRSVSYEIEIHPNTYGNSKLERDEEGKIYYSSIKFYPTLEEIKEEIDSLYEACKETFCLFHSKKLKMFFDVSLADEV